MSEHEEVSLLKALLQEKQKQHVDALTQEEAAKLVVIEKSEFRERIAREIVSLEEVIDMVDRSRDLSTEGITVAAVSQSSTIKTERPSDSPEDWIRQKYRPGGIVVAVKSLLENNSPNPLSTADLTIAIYEVGDEGTETFIRARNSLSAALRRGADIGKWDKVGRGYFRACTPTDNVLPNQAENSPKLAAQLERNFAVEQVEAQTYQTIETLLEV